MVIGDLQRSGHREVLADMVDPMDLVRVDEPRRVLVADDGIVLPAVPQAQGHLQEFVGAAVPMVGVGVVRIAEIGTARVGVRRGHDVPPGAALADVVEGREAPGQAVGVVVGRRRGGDQPDLAGGARERRSPG